jgi:hypothetical protein
LATPQQYHQLHPAAQAAQRHNVLSRRDEENLHSMQGHLHSGLSASVYGDGINTSVSNSSVSRRQSEMVYASVRRPDVLMHGTHHLSDQDLLNLQNAHALSALEDQQVSKDNFPFLSQNEFWVKRFWSPSCLIFSVTPDLLLPPDFMLF